MSEAKGLPGELMDCFGVFASFDNKEKPTKLLSAAKKANTANKKEAIIAKIKLVDRDGVSFPLRTFVMGHYTALLELLNRRKDIPPFLKDNDNTFVDVVAFLEGITEARTKAIKGNTCAMASDDINYRAGEFSREETVLQFSSALNTVNKVDDLFFNKYFAVKKEGSQVRTVLVDRENHCTMYELETCINNAPDALLSRINDDIALYISSFDDFLRHTSPEIEKYRESLNKVVSWRDVKSGRSTVEDYVKFVDNFLIERAFDDEWCKANGREPIPHLVLLMHDKVFTVIQKESTVSNDNDSHVVVIEKPIRYELKFNKYIGPKGYVYTLISKLLDHKYTSYNTPSPVDVLPLSNNEGELCKHFIPRPTTYKTRSTNNDELLKEAIKLCGDEITTYLKTLFRLEGDEKQAVLSREQLGREMYFVASTIDSRSMCSQSLATADDGGKGKTGFHIDFIGHALNHMTDPTFVTFQDSNIFTQDFSGRSNVFDSILCIVDEYDGSSALDDSSWFKKVTGSNSKEATYSAKELKSANVEYNVSHLRFAFLCNVESMVLGSDAERRRTLPVIFDGLEGDYDFKNKLPLLQKSFDKFLLGCWHYYAHTALRNKNDDYILLTPEEYLKFVGDGIVPYSQTKDAARNAFMNDQRLQVHYTMMDFTNKWANDELYEELFDACFVADEEYVVPSRDVYTYVARVYHDTESLNSQGLLDFEKGAEDFKRGKGTGWCTFTKWIRKKYPFVNFQYKTNGKNSVKGLKLKGEP